MVNKKQNVQFQAMSSLRFAIIDMVSHYCHHGIACPLHWIMAVDGIAQGHIHVLFDADPSQVFFCVLSQ